MPPAKTAKTDAAVAVVVDGTTHTFRLAEATALDARDCRKALGLSLRGLMMAAKDDPDIDIIAAIVWLARRQAGDRELPFGVVAADIGYDTSIEGVEAGPEETDPET